MPVLRWISLKCFSLDPLRAFEDGVGQNMADDRLGTRATYGYISRVLKQLIDLISSWLALSFLESRISS